jgi:predicted site-specific integrase-resolvase
MLSVAKVAALFDVTTYTANKWIRKDKLFGEPVKINERWYVKEDAVNAYINRRYG